MITALVLLTLAAIIALVVIIIGGFLYVLWPVALVLAIGLLIDVFVLKLIFKKG